MRTATLMGSRAERFSENARHVFNTAENSKGFTFGVRGHIRVYVMVFQLHFRIRLFDVQNRERERKTRMLLQFYGDAAGNGAERDILCVMLFSMVGGKPETYI